MAIKNFKNPELDLRGTGPSPIKPTVPLPTPTVVPEEMGEKSGGVVTSGSSANMSDPRFSAVEAEKSTAITDLEGTYDGMIGGSDQYFQAQQDAVEQWGEKQLEAQKASTDFTIEQLEAQKAKAEEDYRKEQSAAYVDWQRQSAQHGVEAERMASMGMKGTGYSESAQVEFYRTYQNRVAVARATAKEAITAFDVAIKDAQLRGDVAAAEIAFSTLQQSLELSLTGFQYKNDLILEKTGQKLALEQEYYNRYLDVLDQINYEDEMARALAESGYRVDKDGDVVYTGDSLYAIEYDNPEDEEIAAAGDPLLGTLYPDPNSLPMGDLTLLPDLRAGVLEAQKGKEIVYFGGEEKTAEQQVTRGAAAGAIKGLGTMPATAAEASPMMDNNKLPLEERSWSVVKDGGTNFMSGVNNNAVLRDAAGNEFTGKQLYKGLVQEGATKKEAQAYMRALGKDLKIDLYN